MDRGRGRRRPPVPRPRPEELPGLRADRKARAVSEHLHVRELSGWPFRVVEVRNPAHKTRYRVALPAYPDSAGQFCGCEDFARRDLGTCKHIEAAALWSVEHPIPRTEQKEGGTVGSRAERLWRRIERALREACRIDALGPIRLRQAGRLLFAPAIRRPL